MEDKPGIGRAMPADNAGEIFFDRPFIEQFATERVAVAVRGWPVINDATVDDASGPCLNVIARVISNGSDAPGTILDACSLEFQRHFDAAGLVIAKGQGNYETLNDEAKNILFFSGSSVKP